MLKLMAKANGGKQKKYKKNVDVALNLKNTIKHRKEVLMEIR